MDGGLFLCAMPYAKFATTRHFAKKKRKKITMRCAEIDRQKKCVHHVTN